MDDNFTMSDEQIQKLNSQIEQRLKALGFGTPPMQPIQNEKGYSSNGEFYNTIDEQELLNRINQSTGNNYTGLARTSELTGNNYPAEIWKPGDGWKSAMPSYTYNNETGFIDVTLPSWMNGESANLYKQTIEPILKSVVGGQVNEYDLQAALQDATDRTFYAMMGQANNEALTAYQNNITKMDSSEPLKQEFVTGYTVNDDGQVVEKIETGEELLKRLNAMSRDDFANWVENTARGLNPIKEGNEQYASLASRQNAANQNAINYSLLRFADKYVDTGKFGLQNFWEGFVTSMSDEFIVSLMSMATGINNEERKKIKAESERLGGTANFSINNEDEIQLNKPIWMGVGNFAGTLVEIGTDIALMNAATSAAASAVYKLASARLLTGGMKWAKIGNFAGRLANAGGISELVSNKLITALASKWGVSNLMNLGKIAKGLIYFGARGVGEALETVQYELTKIAMGVISDENWQDIPTFEEFLQDVASDLIVGGVISGGLNVLKISKAKRKAAQALADAGKTGRIPGTFEIILRRAVENMDDTDMYKAFKRKQKEAQNIINGKKIINNSTGPVRNLTPEDIRREMLNNNPFKQATERSTADVLSNSEYALNTPKTRLGTNRKNLETVLGQRQPKISSDNIDMSMDDGVQKTITSSKKFADGVDISKRMKTTTRLDDGTYVSSKKTRKATKAVASVDDSFAKSSKRAKKAKVQNAVEKSEVAEALAAGQDPTDVVTKKTKTVKSNTSSLDDAKAEVAEARKITNANEYVKRISEIKNKYDEDTFNKAINDTEYTKIETEEPKASTKKQKTSTKKAKASAEEQPFEEQVNQAYKELIELQGDTSDGYFEKYEEWNNKWSQEVRDEVDNKMLLDETDELIDDVEPEQMPEPEPVENVPAKTTASSKTKTSMPTERSIFVEKANKLGTELIDKSDKLTEKINKKLSKINNAELTASIRKKMGLHSSAEVNDYFVEAGNGYKLRDDLDMLGFRNAADICGYGKEGEDIYSIFAEMQDAQVKAEFANQSTKTNSGFTNAAKSKAELIDEASESVKRNLSYVDYWESEIEPLVNKGLIERYEEDDNVDYILKDNLTLDQLEEVYNWEKSLVDDYDIEVGNFKEVDFQMIKDINPDQLNFGDLKPITEADVVPKAEVKNATVVNTENDIPKALKEKGLQSIKDILNEEISTKEFNKKFTELPENVQTMIGNYIDKMHNGEQGINRKTVLEALSNKSIVEMIDAERVANSNGYKLYAHGPFGIFLDLVNEVSDFLGLHKINGDRFDSRVFNKILDFMVDKFENVDYDVLVTASRIIEDTMRAGVGAAVGYPAYRLIKYILDNNNNVEEDLQNKTV